MTLRWAIWHVASPSQWLLACAIAGALMLLVAGDGRRGGALARAGRRLSLAGGLGLLVFGLLPTSHYLANALEARFPSPALPEDVAGIVLLAGSERPAPSEAYREPQLGEAGSRYVAALRLAARYPEARVVFTGDAPAGPDRRPLGSQTDVAAEILGSVGLDRRRVTLETGSRDSCDHPRNVKALVGPAAGEAWLVVTSAMHMPRVIGCFRAAGWPQVIPYPTDYRVVLGGWGVGTFRITDNLALLDTALHEWVGLAYYRLTGRIAEFFPAP